MTLRELIKKSGLTMADLDKEIIFYSDEELNQGHSDAEIAIGEQTGRLLLYPLSGSEVE